jgi:acyl carrier protein phosphodiesterase
MNYLAHLYLAGADEELLVGNFIADSVKGSHYKNYSKGVSQGILMHRAIDYFSDTHPIYLKSVHRLAPKHGKFSGVITDMLFDYLLASNWKDFSDASLEDFAEKAYPVLHTHSKLMPEKSRIILQYMSKHNWLLSYKSAEGIRRALQGLSSRMKYYHPMHEAMDQIQADITSYTADFYEFFPQLQEHVKDFKK